MRTPRALAFALFALLAGCEKPPRAAAPAGERIVSLLPSTTEMLFAIEAGATVVGVDANSDYPAAVTALPRVGGYNTYSVEAITALRPTLVVGEAESFDAAFEARLRKAGLATLFCHRNTLRDIDACITRLGARLGRAVEAARVIAAMNETRERALALRPAVPPKTLVTVQAHPIYAVGDRSFVGELLRLAGGKNILDDTASFPLIHPETVVDRAPEVIIVFEAGDIAYFLSTPEFAAVPAVRDRRVFAVDATLIGRPGPRIYDAMLELARALSAPAR